MCCRRSGGGATWRLHHSLQVLLLQLLDALRFGLAVLLQAANFVHILIVQKPQVRCLMVQFPDLGLELWNGTRTGKSHHAKSEEHQDYGCREGQRPSAPPGTSGDSILVLLPSEKLLVELIVLPDKPSMFCPVRLQNRVRAAALSLGLAC